MLGEQKSLFTQEFFNTYLDRLELINAQEFTVRHFTIDSRIAEDADLYCFIGVKGERFDGNDFFEQAYQNGIRVFILNKKPSTIPSDAIVYIVGDTILSLGNLAHAYKNLLMIPSIMITGSVGKTTTRLILSAILKQKYTVHTAPKNWNNAFGTPLTILATPNNARIMVLEAGMNSKGEIGYLSNMVNPDIAVITNIGSSHVGELGGVRQIAEAKIEIAEGMNNNSLLLIPQKSEFKDYFVEEAMGHVVSFDAEDLEVVEDRGLDGFVFRHNEYPEIDFHCPIPGTHLLSNLAIIFALIDVLQIPLDVIQDGLYAIEGLENRMRVFENKKGAKIIADCYNASLESFKAGLDVLNKTKGRKIAVIGSVLELGQESESVHREIGRYIDEMDIDLVLAVGDDMNYTCTELKTTPYCHFPNKEDIWAVLQNEVKQDDVVLVKASNGIGLSVIVTCLESI